MKFIYVVRTYLHLYPPCLAQILMLRELGENVIVVFGGCDSKTEDMLKAVGIETRSMDIKRSRVKLIGKLQSYMLYRKQVLKVLDEVYQNGDCIWFGTADSCFSLGKKADKYPFILNVLELYDENAMYRKGVGRVIHDAKAVVACEKTRADIMKMWWGLRKRPYVMPNKPYQLPEKETMGSIAETKQMIGEIIGKKAFLYQGIISADRDLGLLANALRKLDRDDIYLVLMGTEMTNSVERLKQIYSNTVYLGYIAAPYHLEVTANAFAGIAYYQGSCLNNLFCAPNKIYEYSGFSLPILCNDVPGLRNTVGKFNAGECVDFDDAEALSSAILRLVENYDTYVSNSKKMFQAVDNFEVVRKVVCDVKTGVANQ